MRRFLTTLFACAVALPLIVDAPASAGESCDLLKRKEVEKAIDRKVKIGPPADGLGGECSFTVRGEPLDIVNVWVLEGDEAEQGYENGVSLAGDDAERVKGVGDKAVYTGSPFNTLYAMDGDTLVYLQYYLFGGEATDAEVKRAVIKLTKKALKRV
jgi:hypothetical protein